MTKSLEEEINNIVDKMDEKPEQDNRQQTPPDEIQDIYVFVVRELEIEEDQSNVVDSEPVQVTTQLQKGSFLPAYAICLFYLFLIFSCIAFQVYEILNPPIATITIIPKSQQLTLNGTLQIGRLLNSITISQSQTVATTGRGHQDAKNATGYITFYNGSNTAQTINAGTVFTGNDGMQVAIDDTVTIPPNNPPVNGQATVAAHALEANAQGNIKEDDINLAFSRDLTVKNFTAFTGGQDERNFPTVAKADISSVATPLKTAVTQSMNAALQSQLRSPEQLYILPCSPTVTPNHNVDDEAIQVQVTVSETCSAVAYNRGELETKVRAFLSTQAAKKLAGYSLFGNIQMKVTQASVSSTSHPLVFLSFQAHGAWIYGLSRQSQERIKELIAGKSKQQAMQVLSSLPGVEKAIISWGDDTRLPKDSRYIHFIMLINAV